MKYKFLVGFFARILNVFVPVKKNSWIFGSDFGNSYKEGSKYLIEYMIDQHPEVNVVFITSNRNVELALRKKGIPCYLNNSLKGLWTILQAQAVFTTQSSERDILFAYPKKNRHFYYLVHGMPLKIALNALPPNYVKDLLGLKSSRLKDTLFSYFVLSAAMKDISFVSASSDFLKPYLEMDFPEHVAVKVLGMPRNDGLFDAAYMQGEKWMEGLEGKLVITYMPTHRKYGMGETSPTLFIQNDAVKQWLQEHNVVILIKNHPNMINKIAETSSNACILDISKMELDPQVVIFHSDILITDYSSVWIDYLLLKRPILFYLYDDFEQNDVGCHYDIRIDPAGHFCYSEEDLFEAIKKIKSNYEAMCPSKEVVQKYHKYVDNKSCERYYEEISRMLKNQ